MFGDKKDDEAATTTATDQPEKGVRYVKYTTSVVGDQNPKAIFRGGTKAEKLTMQIGEVKAVSQDIFERLARKHGTCFDEVDEKTYKAFQKRKAQEVEAAQKQAAKDLAKNRQAGPISTR